MIPVCTSASIRSTSFLGGESLALRNTIPVCSTLSPVRSWKGVLCSHSVRSRRSRCPAPKGTKGRRKESRTVCNTRQQGEQAMQKKRTLVVSLECFYHTGVSLLRTILLTRPHRRVMRGTPVLFPDRTSTPACKSKVRRKLRLRSG